MIQRTGIGEEAAEQELAPSREVAFLAGLDEEVPSGVQDGGGQRQNRSREHGIGG